MLSLTNEISQTNYFKKFNVESFLTPFSSRSALDRIPLYIEVSKRKKNPLKIVQKKRILQMIFKS
jgi:L-cystine uptake protein TcyP (sodium:dicarboxylate symporter family)